jgi:hypothetical protein
MKDGKLFVCKESIIDGDGANTDSAVEKIHRDLTSKGFHVYVIADSTGKKETTNSRGRTDLEIMKRGGLEVMHFRNPFIRDRQNGVNVLFKNQELHIDKSCSKLIKEIETLSGRYKEGDVAHVSVGMGYVAWKLKPLRTQSSSSTINW